MGNVHGLVTRLSGPSSTSTLFLIQVCIPWYCRASLCADELTACVDPSDIAALDESPVAAKDVKVDEASEAQRPEDKRKAQEWAGLAQDPNSNLFVFVGRWSKQKGMCIRLPLNHIRS